MIFKHDTSYEFQELESETTENGRFYTTPSGLKYPSVTTVLGHGSDQTWKNEWIARIGKEEADRVSRRATSRGTAVHLLLEQYLKNNPEYLKGQMPSNIMSFKKIKHFLDENVTEVMGLEVPLYSDYLRVAGRVDCIAQWQGEWAIVDFKTSKRPKTKESISGYFMQTSCYSYMVYERLGVLPKKLVILMTVDEGEGQVFVERSKDWIQSFIDLRNKVPL